MPRSAPLAGRDAEILWTCAQFHLVADCIELLCQAATMTSRGLSGRLRRAARQARSIGTGHVSQPASQGAGGTARFRDGAVARRPRNHGASNVIVSIVRGAARDVEEQP
jgi:hypothetical protein